MKDMLLHAHHNNYAVMAINCVNMEQVKAVIESAEEQGMWYPSAFFSINTCPLLKTNQAQTGASCVTSSFFISVDELCHAKI